MVAVVMQNKQGEKTQVWRRQCFGFMSEVDCWDEDEEWDDDLEEYVGTPMDGFSSDNLKFMYFIHESAQKIESEERKKVMDGIKIAMEGLPQYYDNVTHDGERFTFDLEGTNMQKTIIGAMMLRNILHYASNRKTFLVLLENGIDAKLAFIMAQRYQMNYSMYNNEYIAYAASGDETIFGDESRVCDVAAMYNGQVGTIYQGNWGDTHCGYGRYGEYDNEDAGDNPRTDNQYDLVDTTLITEGYEDSPYLHTFENEVCGRTSFDVNQILTLAAAFKAKF